MLVYIWHDKSQLKTIDLAIQYVKVCLNKIEVKTMSADPKISAELLLKSVWGDRPLPVDPVWIARQMGIDVKETALPDEVSGAIIKDKDKDPVIILSQADSKNRKRFTCAHEIGHYIYRMLQGEDHYEYVDLRGPDAQKGQDPEEIFANQLAAALLMPEDKVKEMNKLKIPSFIMAQNFGVSGDAINFRLKNLGIQG